MKKLSFDDAFFVRMKFQKSIQLPKAPLKTPKQTLSPFHAIIEASKPFSPLKNSKQEKSQASQYRIDAWIAKKQAKVRESIDKQKQINRQLSIYNTSANVLKLKKREDWEMCQQNKSKSKINNFPVLLKEKQNQQMIKSLSGSKNSKRVTPATENRQIKGISMTQSSTNLKLFQNSRSYSQRGGINSTSFVESSKNKKQDLKLSLSFMSQQKSQQISTDESSKSIKLNPIYVDNTKGTRLIKKYDNREMSPIDRKELRNKYSNLQRRLDSILRSVKTQKQTRN